LLILTIILFKNMGILLASDPGAGDGEQLPLLGISKMGANCWGRFTYSTLSAMGRNSSHNTLSPASCRPAWQRASQKATQSDWSLLTASWLANSKEAAGFLQCITDSMRIGAFFFAGGINGGMFANQRWDERSSMIRYDHKYPVVLITPQWDYGGTGIEFAIYPTLP
jgi:hypothetical protein